MGLSAASVVFKRQPFPLGQGGGMMRMGGSSSSVAASGNYVYVVSGNTLYQFSVDGLKLVAKTTLPTASRGESGGQGAGRGEGGGNRRNNPPVK